jgi:hypothetical protein
MYAVCQRNRRNPESAGFELGIAGRTSGRCESVACRDTGGSLRGVPASTPTRRPCGSEGTTSRGYRVGSPSRNPRTSPTVGCGEPASLVLRCTSGRCDRLALAPRGAGAASSALGNPHIRRAKRHCSGRLNSGMFAATQSDRSASRSCAAEPLTEPCRSACRTSRTGSALARRAGRVTRQPDRWPASTVARTPWSNTTVLVRADSAVSRQVCHTTSRAGSRESFALCPDKLRRSTSASGVCLAGRTSGRNTGNLSYQGLYHRERSVRYVP